jgi:hypothetical protein
VVEAWLGGVAARAGAPGPLSRRFPFAQDGVRSLRDTLPSVDADLRRVAEHEREKVWTEIEHALRDYEGHDGLVAPGELLIGVGTK